MKIKKRGDQLMEFDLTPMIDMTFQLIAFFMILINFDENHADERILLPTSELAKPPQGALLSPITLLVAKDGKPIYDGEVFEDATLLKPKLNNEKFVMQQKGKSEKEANIIIRAHQKAKMGQLQNLIKVCQEVGFEKFTLRAMNEPK